MSPRYRFQWGRAALLLLLGVSADSGAFAAGSVDDVTEIVADDHCERGDTQLENRIPLLFIHGIHGTSNINQMGSSANAEYFGNLLRYLCSQGFNRNYKFYRFHYESDQHSVATIGAALRNDIDAGKFPNQPFIIIAHSMGGLVARSYMIRQHANGERGGDRVIKLITLATPHHGSPAANGLVRFRPKGQLESGLGSVDANAWAQLAQRIDFLKWYIMDGCPKCAKDPRHPNRADLRWDNSNGLWGSGYESDFERNSWLITLNSNTSFDNKITAYSGHLADRAEVSLFGSDVGESGALNLLGRAATYFIKDKDKYFGNKNAQGFAGVLIERIMKQDTSTSFSFINNDGLVPRESARFDGHQIAKIVECPGHNHEDMKDGSPLISPTCITTGLSLFASVAQDIPRIEWVTPPPVTMVSGQSYTISWRVLGGVSVTHTNVHRHPNDPANSSLCSSQTIPSCQTTSASGAPGTFSATITAPSVASETRYRYAAHATVDGVTLWTPIHSFLGGVAYVQPAAGAKLSIPPAGLDFSTVAVNASKDIFFPIRNLGDATLTGTVSAGSPFSVASGDSFSLAKGERHYALVRFAPTAAGLATGTLSVISNAGNQSRSLTGRGIADTAPSLPTLNTQAASGIGQTNATLNATVHPSGTSTRAWFEWEPFPGPCCGVRSNDYFIPRTNNTTPITNTLSGLTPGTQYRFRIVAENAVGVKQGSWQFFTAQAAAAAPLICVGPTLYFSATAGAPLPTGQSFNVWNCGSGTLEWTAETVSPWLVLSSTYGASTGQQNPVSVSLDLANVSAGEYQTEIWIYASGAANSGQGLPVLLSLAAIAPAQPPSAGAAVQFMHSPFSFPYFAGSVGGQAHKLVRDGQGNLLVGGQGGVDHPRKGIFTYDPQGNFASFLPTDGTRIALDGNGNLFSAIGREPGGCCSNGIYLSKLSSSGSVLWSRSQATTTQGTLREVEADASGNAYLAGNEFVRILENGLDYFAYRPLLISYDPNGTLRWLRTPPRTYTHEHAGAADVALAPGGVFYAAGLARRANVTLNSGGGTDVSLTNDYSLWLAKYSQDGTHLWSRSYVIPATGLAVDLGHYPNLAVDSTGNTYVATDETPLGGTRRVRVLKYSSGGELLWTVTYGDNALVRDAAVDTAGRLHLAVYSPNRSILLRYDAAGNLERERSFGGKDLLAASESGEPFALALAENNDAYVGGNFRLSSDIGGPNRNEWLIGYDKEGVSLRLRPPPLAGIPAGKALGVSSIAWTWADATDKETGYHALSREALWFSTRQMNATSWVLNRTYGNTSLSTNTAYGLELYAFNEDGYSEVAKARACTLAASPGAASVIARGPFWIELAWSSGTNPAGTSYEILAATATDAPALVSVRVDGSLGGTARGLLPSTTYYARVRAINCDNIPSEVTVAVTTVTLPVPAAVTAQAVPFTGGKFLGKDAVTAVELVAGFPTDSNLFLSRSPLQEPIAVSTADISEANNRLGGTKLLPDSIREIVLMAGDAMYEGSISATLTLPYPDANNDGFVDGIEPPLKPDQLAIHTLVNQRWEAVPGPYTVETASRTISANLTHFSVFALIGTAAAADLSAVRAYPIPWKPGAGGRFDSANVGGCGRGIVFDNLTSEATVRIYNVVGDLVRELGVSAADAGCKAWDGRNDSGSDVASGIYIAIIKGGGGKSVKKLAIER